jgi:hypothetical protein
VVIRVFLILTITIFAKSPSIELKDKCLKCHIKQKIPSELIYRRYLLYYSSKEVIREKIFRYLKNPKKENSIMPSQFFLKFPMKKRMDINNTHLIDEYLKLFDIKSKLILIKEH